MATRMLDMDVNDTNAWQMYGFLESLSVDFGRTKNISPILQKVFAETKVRFEAQFDMVAAGAQNTYHHVYEWNAVGVPQARLFETVMVGTGKRRAITFRWKASRTPVPVPDVPASKTGKQLQKGVHVFVWKAPIMEYNIPVLISPTMSEVLAFPANDLVTRQNESGLWFTRKPVRIRQPGGAATTGAFNAYFLAYWTGGPAEAQFREILDGVAKDHGAKMINSLRLSTVASRKTTESARRKAFKMGEAQAQKFFGRRNADYIQQAYSRREFTGRRGGAERFE